MGIIAYISYQILIIPFSFIKEGGWSLIKYLIVCAFIPESLHYKLLSDNDFWSPTIEEVYYREQQLLQNNNSIIIETINNTYIVDSLYYYSYIQVYPILSKLLYIVAITISIMLIVMVLLIFSLKVNSIRSFSKLSILYTSLLLTVDTISNFKKINKGSSIATLKHSSLDEVLMVGLISFYFHILCSVISCSLIYFIFDIFGIFLYFLLVVFIIIAKLFLLNKNNLVLSKKNNYGKIKYIINKLLFSIRLILMTTVRAITLFLRVTANITVGITLITVLVHLLFNIFYLELRCADFFNLLLTYSENNLQFNVYLIYLFTYIIIPIIFILLLVESIYYLSIYEILVIFNQIQLAATLIIIYILEVNTH